MSSSRSLSLPRFITLLLLLLLTTTSKSTPFDLLKTSKASTSMFEPHKKPQEYIEVTVPLPSNTPKPSCTHPIIRHSFANTINRPPFSIPYSPPSKCPPPWSHVFLNFNVNSKGEQYDRISGLWLGGVEIFRTSTAQPTSSGIFWNVTKEVTRYTSLLSKTDLNFTLMLENVVNEIYTGVYHVEAKLLFYNDYYVRKSSLGPRNNKNMNVRELREVFGSFYQSPADLIIPISAEDGDLRGYWFKIEKESDVKFKKFLFPRNTYKVVLELYVSFHGNDEFYYSNPPDSYIRRNNLTTLRGNGAFREVYVTIDKRIVASEVPFPVVFTGGINPLFWEPLVGIGAFNLPSYNFDLTPFLGMLLDGNNHTFGIGVTEGISYWLVDANLHIWLDHPTSVVRAQTVMYDDPESIIERVEQFRMLDGTFRIQAEREAKLVGWVHSSHGNFSTTITKQFRFRNQIRYAMNGTCKYIKQKVRSKIVMKMVNEGGCMVKRVDIRGKYPLKVITATLPGSKKDTYKLLTNVSHAFKERYRSKELSSNIHNEQISYGWMEVRDHSVLTGEAMTNQTLTSSDVHGCYVRSVAALDGTLIADNTMYVCPSLMSM